MRMMVHPNRPTSAVLLLVLVFTSSPSIIQPVSSEGNSNSTNNTGSNGGGSGGFGGELFGRCTLPCQNNGECKFGRANFGMHTDHERIPGLEHTHENDMYCACHDEYTGIRCEIKMEICPEDGRKAGNLTCFNGATCDEKLDDFGKSYYYCNCDSAQSDLSSAYAGLYCQHKATMFCANGGEGASKHTFCVNGGRCKDMIDPGEDHQGCNCPDGWEGPHCEYVTESSFEIQEAQTEVGKAIFFFINLIAIAGTIVGIVVVLRNIRKDRIASGEARPVVSAEPGALEADGSSTLQQSPRRESENSENDSDRSDTNLI